jgi:hypothetical protein
MLDDLSFGWRTAVLTVAVIQLLVIAAALTRTLANRAANRTLAALLLVMASIVTPWLIGFAGFYDKWHWLSFAPFQITLAVPPLAWLYVTALTDGGWPRGAWRHLIPAVLQFGYLAACFCLPLEAKLAWADRSAAMFSLIVSAVLVVQMVYYGRSAARQLSAYRTALRDHVADQTRFAVRWLAAALGALALLFTVWTGYLVWDLVAPLSYLGLMGLYLAIAAVALYLGIEGWRHAALPFPHLADFAANPAPASDNRDWAAQGREWAELIRANGWARMRILPSPASPG